MSKKNELISGIAFLAIGLILFIGSYFVDSLSTSSVGPDFLPRVIGGMIAILSFFVIVPALKMQTDAKIEKTGKKTFKEIFLNNKDIVTIILILAYVNSIEVLGFIISSIIYLSLQITLFRPVTKVNIIKNVIISVVATIVINLVFVNGLGLLLPTGMFM